MSKAAFYRLCRDWHGYLSAIAFLALLLFSVTGLLLNHPGLLEGAPPVPLETQLALAPDEIASVRASADPASALASVIAGKTRMVGAFRSGDVVGEDIYADFQGVRGRSSATANLNTGRVRVVMEREGVVGMLNGLHRGEHAGWIWRLFIDAMAVVFILVSIIGALLFLSLRFRLRSALMLMGGSLLAMAGLILFAAT